MELRLATGSSANIEHYIISAKNAAQRAASLTHRLLTFSRRQTLDPQPTDIAQLLQSIEELLRRGIGPDIRFDIHLDAGPWWALCDANQLENALLNLAINSRDAMPSGGHLTIALSKENIINGVTGQHPEAEPGDYLQICVCDDGVGMTPEVATRALEPFFTTKPMGHGTGLGLSRTYGFVRQSGGHMSIESTTGKGTNVELLLPRHAPLPPMEQAMAMPAAMAVAERGATVMLVKDEDAVRDVAAEMLRLYGYSVIEAVDGSDGLQKLDGMKRCDLLITDVGLPNGMNGRQVADAARVRNPGLKVLFITGFAENAVVGSDRLPEGMYILTKPFSMAALAQRVRSIVGAHDGIRPY